VVFYGKSESPPIDTLTRILKAGGGQVLSRSAPYTSVLPVPAGNGTTVARCTAASGKSGKGSSSRASGGGAAVAAEDPTARASVANLAVVGEGKASSASDR
jgi:hypothetical protein